MEIFDKDGNRIGEFIEDRKDNIIDGVSRDFSLSGCLGVLFEIFVMLTIVLIVYSIWVLITFIIKLAFFTIWWVIRLIFKGFWWLIRLPFCLLFAKVIPEWEFPEWNW